MALKGVSKIVEGAEEARLQRAQLDRYLKWVREEGASEGPTHLPTMFLPEQLDRMNWLKAHATGSILEAGCNYGFVLAFCGGQMGLDINEKSVLLARILNPQAVFTQGDVCAMPFPDRFVDTVMIPDCLEHLDWEDVDKALKEAYRVAIKKVLATMPNGDFISRHSSSFKHRFLLTEDRLKTLLNLMAAAKWTVNVHRTYHWTFIEILKEAQVDG